MKNSRTRTTLELYKELDKWMLHAFEFALFIEQVQWLEDETYCNYFCPFCKATVSKKCEDGSGTNEPKIHKDHCIVHNAKRLWDND